MARICGMMPFVNSSSSFYFLSYSRQGVAPSVNVGHITCSSESKKRKISWGFENHGDFSRYSSPYMWWLQISAYALYRRDAVCPLCRSLKVVWLTPPVQTTALLLTERGGKTMYEFRTWSASAGVDMAIRLANVYRSLYEQARNVSISKICGLKKITYFPGDTHMFPNPIVLCFVLF